MTSRELTYTSCYPTSDGGVTIAVATPSGAMRYVTMSQAKALEVAADLLLIVSQRVAAAERSLSAQRTADTVDRVYQGAGQ